MSYKSKNNAMVRHVNNNIEKYRVINEAQISIPKVKLYLTPGDMNRLNASKESYIKGGKMDNPLVQIYYSPYNKFFEVIKNYDGVVLRVETEKQDAEAKYELQLSEDQYAVIMSICHFITSHLSLQMGEDIEAMPKNANKTNVAQSTFLNSMQSMLMKVKDGAVDFADQYLGDQDKKRYVKAIKDLSQIGNDIAQRLKLSNDIKLNCQLIIDNMQVEDIAQLFAGGDRKALSKLIELSEIDKGFLQSIMSKLKSELINEDDTISLKKIISNSPIETKHIIQNIFKQFLSHNTQTASKKVIAGLILDFMKQNQQDAVDNIRQSFNELMPESIDKMRDNGASEDFIQSILSKSEQSIQDIISRFDDNDSFVQRKLDALHLSNIMCNTIDVLDKEHVITNAEIEYGINHEVRFIKEKLQSIKIAIPEKFDDDDIYWMRSDNNLEKLIYALLRSNKIKALTEIIFKVEQILESDFDFIKMINENDIGLTFRMEAVKRCIDNKYINNMKTKPELSDDESNIVKSINRLTESFHKIPKCVRDYVDGTVDMNLIKEIFGRDLILSDFSQGGSLADGQDIFRVVLDGLDNIKLGGNYSESTKSLQQLKRVKDDIKKIPEIVEKIKKAQIIIHDLQIDLLPQEKLTQEEHKLLKDFGDLRLYIAPIKNAETFYPGCKIAESKYASDLSDNVRALYSNNKSIIDSVDRMDDKFVSNEDLLRNRTYQINEVLVHHLSALFLQAQNCSHDGADDFCSKALQVLMLYGMSNNKAEEITLALQEFYQNSTKASWKDKLHDIIDHILELMGIVDRADNEKSKEQRQSDNINHKAKKIIKSLLKEDAMSDATHVSHTARGRG